MKIYLTAVIKSKPEFLDEVTTVLQNMVTETRKEAGCLQYDLHQSFEDKNVFVFYEIWESKQVLDEHNQQPYISTFVKLWDEKLVSAPDVFLTEKL